MSSRFDVDTIKNGWSWDSGRSRFSTIFDFDGANGNMLQRLYCQRKCGSNGSLSSVFCLNIPTANKKFKKKSSHQCCFDRPTCAAVLFPKLNLLNGSRRK